MLNISQCTAVGLTFCPSKASDAKILQSAPNPPRALLDLLGSDSLTQSFC